MKREMLKSKIHRATITDFSVDYEGSITIDEELMKAANIIAYEKVLVADINNGSRFETYVIKGRPGSGEICVNGAAANLVNKNDKVIIMSFFELADSEAFNYKPLAIKVDQNNQIAN